MLTQIVFLFITARQINFSHQCELHSREGGSHFNVLPFPGPFPCGGSVPGIPTPVAPGPVIIPARPVAAVNLGPENVDLNLGSLPVNLGPGHCSLGNAPVSLGPASVHLGAAPVNYGLSSVNLGPGPMNLGPAVANVGTNSRICASGPSLSTARGLLSVTGSTSLPFSNISPIRLAELIATGAGLQYPIAGSVPVTQFSQPCIRHALVPVPIQVVEECITNVPVIRKTVRHQAETYTRHVPIHEKTVTRQLENIVRHIPVVQKSIRNVVETSVRHVPVIKSRSRTVIEPYTFHVPITERYIRPVEESITRTVPYSETRVKPVVVERTRLVPVVERRCRPVVETNIQNVPVRRNYVRNFVERRVRPVIGPCNPCVPYYGGRDHAAEQYHPESSSHESKTEEIVSSSNDRTIPQGDDPNYTPNGRYSPGAPYC